MASIPKPGAFVHVFIQPFASNGQPKLADQNGELGMEGLERGDDLWKELEWHEGGVGEEGLVEFIESLCEEVVEATHGSVSAHHAIAIASWWRLMDLHIYNCNQRSG